MLLSAAFVLGAKEFQLQPLALTVPDFGKAVPRGKVLGEDPCSSALCKAELGVPVLTGALGGCSPGQLGAGVRIAVGISDWNGDVTEHWSV